MQISSDRIRCLVKIKFYLLECSSMHDQAFMFLPSIRGLSYIAEFVNGNPEWKFPLTLQALNIHFSVNFGASAAGISFLFLTNLRFKSKTL